MKFLFWEDSYISEFQATVLAAHPGEVTLDQTAFFPESGGQIFDIGSIDSVPVRGAQFRDEKERVIHLVEDASRSLTVGQTVACKVDWPRRHTIMKLHSALHFAYLWFIDEYGPCRLRGSQIRPDKARLDFEYFGKIDVEKLSKFLEQVIDEDLPITTEFVNSDEPFQRQWRAGQFQPIACGGTHVRSTGEIGPISTRLKSLGSQGARIYLLPPS